MQKSETIRARIEPHLKAKTEAIFSELGLSSSQAINLFYKQVTLHKGLPFDVKLPNEIAQKALKDSLESKNLNSYESLEDLKNKF
ncbi:MAG: type II toxin-antitoxin system antitoxin, RelB/DinJ family [Alphaproteobacteria bacterium CG11_big_fil_rev_8_21_14_0_20_39_49]|nr:MAG: type II toxin-antitoxin system antitoxin, RelB/DinJ family [Alphaproteobacteria bacterium CG11_big_fil_rev_8_21_14_0_20_39_49]